MAALPETLQTRVGDKLTTLFLTDTCVVENPALSIDPKVDSGYGTPANLACMVQRIEQRPQVGVIGGRVEPEADVEIAFTRGADVKQGARITVRGQVYTAMDDAGRNTIRFLDIIPAKNKLG